MNTEEQHATETSDPHAMNGGINWYAIISLLGIIGVAGFFASNTERLRKVIEISLQTGNTDGANEAALKETVKFLEEEIAEDCGVPVRIPYDQVGALSSTSPGRPAPPNSPARSAHACAIPTLSPYPHAGRPARGHEKPLRLRSDPK